MDFLRKFFPLKITGIPPSLLRAIAWGVISKKTLIAKT
jgi:hypothetical protein